MWTWCVKVASNLLFRLSVWRVGRMNTGWVNSELVGSMRNRERMMFNSVNNVEMPSEMSYLLFIYPHWMAECSLPESQELCLEMTVLALVLARIAESRDRRMFENKNSFSWQSNFPFYVAKIQPKTYLGLPQASHGIMAESMKVNPTKVLISMRHPPQNTARLSQSKQ